VVSALLVTTNAVLLRGILEIGQQLGLPSQRAAAMAALIGFLGLGLLVEFPLVAGALRMGRTLDLRLRMAFLAKIPRLDDRYFRSRLLSDMAERGHSLHLVRGVPVLGVRLLASSAQLLFTVLGIAWLQPSSALLAVVAAAVCIGMPLALQPLLAERDLRMRSHSGALGRFYLDALLGLLPIRVHGARTAMQRQQESLLVDWARAGLRFYSAATLVDGALALGGLTMAVVMVWSVASHPTSGLLLLVYWALSLPALGQDIAIVARQYPVLRNVVLRLLEPLGTPEPIEPAASGSEASAAKSDAANSEAATSDAAAKPAGDASRTSGEPPWSTEETVKTGAPTYIPVSNDDPTVRTPRPAGLAEKSADPEVVFTPVKVKQSAVANAVAKEVASTLFPRSVLVTIIILEALVIVWLLLRH
jgi:ATP-binding cassette subfamily B protein